MKYPHLSAFEKHLEQAAKVQLSRVFLVVSSCSYERKKIAERIAAAIRVKEGEIHLQIGEGKDLEEQIDSLNTSSLLSGVPVVFLDGIDKLKKNGLSLLADYTAKPSPFSYLILGSGSSKGLSDLYAKGKKELISCDLSEEKPWDKKDRLKRAIADLAMKAGLRLNGDAAEHLLENVGSTLPGLEQELLKLITYAGERKEITLQDVHALCAAEKSSTFWQLAEAIVWRDSPPKTDEDLDLSSLLPLLSQLRTQLQQGMTLAVLMERGCPSGDIAHYLPTMKHEKFAPIAKKRRSGFFKRALDLLFEVELMAKNSSFDPALIFDLFVTKITLLKRYYGSPVISQSPR